MDSLEDAIRAVEGHRRTLDVYTAAESVASELERQFSTRNVRVARERVPPRDDPGFVVVRDEDGTFRGAVGVEQLRTLLAPEVRPPWTDDADEEVAEAFDFLQNTIFTSYDRRQMLAAAREIEERAWRANRGWLYVGFQRADAFESQLPVYDRFATERALTIRIFVDDEWAEEAPGTIEVVSDAGGEIGEFWFVLFHADGPSSCGLLAEERSPGRFYGFWTYDPGRVEALVDHLDERYVD